MIMPLKGVKKKAIPKNTMKRTKRRLLRNGRKNIKKR